MDLNDVIATVLTLLFTVVPTVLATVMSVNKKLGLVTKEINEFFAVIATSLADGKLTGDEIKTIIDEADDIPGAIRNALNRK